MYTFSIAQLLASPVTAELVQSATRRDPCLSKVLRFVREGWPREVADEFKPYGNRRLELSTEGDCLFWGNRVIIPRRLRARLLDELHREHAGITRMKAMARSYLWFPGVD